MSGKNYLAFLNELAVSAYAAESALNTEQTLDLALLVDSATVISLEHKRESNADESTGKEEPDAIYNLGATSSVSLSFSKAQPQHFGFGYSYALGVSTPAAAGTGLKHAIRPTSGMDLKSFTAAQRLGLTILKRRFASMFVDQLAANFSKDAWAKLTLSVKGTGKYTDNILKELITADYNVASLTLAANGVEGDDAPARLDNVHQIRALIPSTGAYREVVYSAVSGATPAVITITPEAPIQIQGLSKAEACVVTWVGHGKLSGDKVTFAGITQADWATALNGEETITKIDADSFSVAVDTSEIVAAYVPGTDPGTMVCTSETTFEVIYVPTEPAWCTFPARVTETPLRVTDLTVTLGGKWNGTSFLGGRAMSSEIESIEHTVSNQLAVEYRVGGTGTYANYVLRKGRTQTLKVNRQMRDFILQQRLIDGEYFGVYVKAEGAEYETGYKYFVEVIFPKCAVLNAPISVGDKVLAEAGDLIVLEDDTYGSVLVNVQNKQAAYAA